MKATKRPDARLMQGNPTYCMVDLDDGRRVQLFVNRDTNLVVLDVIDNDDKGGVEVYRRNV